MWTVTVTLLDGSTEKYRDKDRKSPGWNDTAYGFSYAVDEYDGLHILRTLRRYNGMNNRWANESAEREVAYYKPARWERVQAT